jgi:hypothetical protein
MTMNRRQFLGYGGAGLLMGASGMLFPRLSSAADQVKTASKKGGGIKPEDLQCTLPQGSKGFCNWYANVTFEHAGLPYVLFAALLAPGFSGKNELTVLGVRGPFKSRKDKALDIAEAEAGLVKDEADKTTASEEMVTIVDDPEWHFRKVFLKEDHEFQQSLSDGTVNVQLGNTKVSCKDGEYKIRLDEADYQIDLDCIARGPAIWWGGKPNREFQLSKNSNINGFESPCNIEGSATIKGEKLTIKGKGVFEHVWITKQDMMELRSVDYIIMNFDEAYTFLYKGISTTQQDQCLVRNHAGGIYLNEDRKLHYFTGIHVKYRNWAYAPKAYRFIPTAFDVTAETGEGRFHAIMDPVATPSWYVHRRMEKLGMDDVEGWNFSYWDAPLKSEGEFTYKNGKVISLTNGRGVNEPQKVSPLT